MPVVPLSGLRRSRAGGARAAGARGRAAAHGHLVGRRPPARGARVVRPPDGGARRLRRAALGVAHAALDLRGRHHQQPAAAAQGLCRLHRSGDPALGTPVLGARAVERTEQSLQVGLRAVRPRVEEARRDAGDGGPLGTGLRRTHRARRDDPRGSELARAHEAPWRDRQRRRGGDPGTATGTAGPRRSPRSASRWAAVPCG
jgi:hypothetical protein